MKKTILTITLAALMLLTGCSGAGSGDSSHSDSAMQAAYDASLDARTFADGLLKDMLSEQGIADYTIDTTSGGFITDDPITYVVGYCYTHDGQTEVYGYKLSQSENGFEGARGRDRDRPGRDRDGELTSLRFDIPPLLEKAEHYDLEERGDTP